MKEFTCLVPGCPWHSRAENVAELVRRGADHLMAVHGESSVRPEMIEHIKDRITVVGEHAPRSATRPL